MKRAPWVARAAGFNVEKATDARRAIKIYPLSSAADPKPIRIVDTTRMAMDRSCLKWEDNIQFYDSATRSQVQTDQDKAALRSMFELKDVKPDAPLDLYFGPNAPAGSEGRWIKTVPGRGWFAYIRI
jgi:hypothetical protein